MTIDNRVFVDTNVLLDATNTARKFHGVAKQVLQSGFQLVFSCQIIREYLVVATRPISVNGFGMAFDEAMHNVTQVRRIVRLLPEEKPILAMFLTNLKSVPVSGKAIHDAWVVATAQVHGIRQIVTANVNDFFRYRNLLDITSTHEFVDHHTV